MSETPTIPPEPFVLNTAQQSGIAGVEEQMERAFALITAARAWLKGWPDDTELKKEDLTTPHILLDMAQEELGDLNCLTRIREGRFR